MTEAIVGRLVLLGSAYAPACLLVGCRAFGSAVGYAFLAVGILGMLVWVAFLRWLPHAQPRDVNLSVVESVDGEVTAYIASYLLPILATDPKTTGDIVAYVLCALLVLVVAFVADLGAVNPIVYLFRLRVFRVEVDGRRMVALCRNPPATRKTSRVAQEVGVLYVLDPS
jgi:hypothetical protein